MNFLHTYSLLENLYEGKASRPVPQGYVEAAKPINLSDCCMIDSDVIDCRGELEASACLEYNGVLTRVAASVLPFRDGPEGKEVFLKLWRSAVYLCGGGIDLDKDGIDPTATVAREAFEESNITLTNIQDSGCSYWEYSEKPWVERHVADPADRWNGYYTWLFTADYSGTGDNNFPEEAGNFRWYKVSDILARPDTKKLRYIKQAIIQNGYAESVDTSDGSDLEEDVVLNEAKQLGYVSYAVRKSAAASGHPISSLLRILNSDYIKASVEEDGSKYVSLSRDLLGHLTKGSDWKCGIILDGDKVSERYKVTPVNYNSMIYFGNNVSAKQLMLRYVAKYQALDEQGEPTDRTFYIVSMNGSSFLNLISQDTYNVLKTLIDEYNGELAVSSTGWASNKYKNKANRDVKKYFHVKHAKVMQGGYNNKAWRQFVDTTDQDLPQWLKDSETKPSILPVGSIMQKERVPRKYSDATWLCTEAAGYNTPSSGLLLKASKLHKYKDTVDTKHGIDVTSPSFFKRIGGQYADEAEERVQAQLIKLVDKYGEETSSNTTDFGMNITGCVRGILIDEKHRDAFKEASEEYLRSGGKLYLYSNGEKTSASDNIPNINELALAIRNYAEQNHIPIILFTPGLTTNAEVIRQLY